MIAVAATGASTGTAIAVDTGIVASVIVAFMATAIDILLLLPLLLLL